MSRDSVLCCSVRTVDKLEVVNKQRVWQRDGHHHQGSRLTVHGFTRKPLVVR